MDLLVTNIPNSKSEQQAALCLLSPQVSDWLNRATLVHLRSKAEQFAVCSVKRINAVELRMYLCALLGSSGSGRLQVSCKAKAPYAGEHVRSMFAACSGHVRRQL